MPIFSNNVVTAAEQAAADVSQPTNPQDPPSKPAVNTLPTTTISNVISSAGAVPVQQTPQTFEDIITKPAAMENTASISSMSASPGIAKQLVRPNALSQCASYNYVLDLYVGDAKSTARMSTDEKFYPSDWYRIVSSIGGVGGAKPGPRLPDDPSTTTVLPNAALASQYFTKEYYIDNLEIHTIAGLKPQDTEVHFTLLEPYGVSFIQELWNFCAKVLNINNYTEACMMLVIGFRGWDDNGQLINLDNYIKYIPILISNIEIKVTSSGSEYVISAAVYNNLSNQKAYGIMPASVEMEGNTLSDLILGGEKNPQKCLSYILNQEGQTVATEDPTNTATSFPTRYAFVFDDPEGVGVDLASQRLVDPKDRPPKDAPMKDTAKTSTQQRDLIEQMKKFQLLSEARNTDNIDTNNSKVNFNKGGQIKEFLSKLIMNSTYVTDQLTAFRNDVIAVHSESDPERRSQMLAALNKPLKWFRIITKTTPTGNFDAKNNIEQKLITYYIRPILVKDTSAAGDVMVPTPDPSDSVVKEYYYFFTGRNTEILNLDIKLDTSMFTYKSSGLLTAQEATGVVADKTEVNAAVSANSNTTPAAGTSAAKPALRSLRKYVDVPLGSAGGGTGVNSAERLTARAVGDTLFSRVDMINTNLEILGDPDLIKQDGVFYITNSDVSDASLGISTEGSERFVRVVFISPTDVDTETGLVTGLDNSDTLFNGIYRFNEVSSSFKQGKFTQTLTLLKYTGPEKASNPPAVVAQSVDANKPKPPVTNGNISQ
jgi:hypothetical protein